MEVYSIINDLDPNYIKEEVCLLGDALLRNKYLLRKYSTEFKNTSPTAFIRRLRFYVKQSQASCSTLSPSRQNYPETLPTEKNSCPSHKIMNMKMGFTSQTTSQKNITRVPGWKTIQNMNKMPQLDRRATKQSFIMCKRQYSLKEESNSQIKIISVGQNIQYYNEKIKTLMNDRYQITLAKLKNMFYGSKSTSLRSMSTYFMKYSLRDTHKLFPRY